MPSGSGALLKHVPNRTYVRDTKDPDMHSPREKRTQNKVTVLNSQAVAEGFAFPRWSTEHFSVASMLREKTNTMVYPLSDQPMRWRLAQAKKHELGVEGGGWGVGEKTT